MPFDSEEFNRRLFFSSPRATSPPTGAVDLQVQVPGASLHVRIHPAAAARWVLLLFHGNGEVVADYDDHAALFARAGAALAVMDYRGYGASTGTPTLRAALTDAPLVLEAVRRWFGERRPSTGDSPSDRLVVMGRSLGSACAAELYGTRPDGIAGFVLESGSSDLAGLVRRRGLAVPGDFSQDARRTFDPLPKLRRGNHPLLVLHGANDTMIAPAEAERAFETAGTRKKKLVLIPGRGHNDVSFADLYWTSLAEFLATLPP